MWNYEKYLKLFFFLYKMSIRVYVFTEISKERATILSESLFSNSAFEVIIPNFDLIPNNTENLENIKVLNILMNGKLKAPNKPLLIIKDTSTSSSDSTHLATMLNEIIEKTVFDIFYLSRWLDKCDMNSPVMTLENKLVRVTTTHYAQGFQAILFSNTGRDKVIDLLQKDDPRNLSDILLDSISRKKMTPLCAIPNLIEFDIKLASNILENTFKNSMCLMNVNDVKDKETLKNKEVEKIDDTNYNYIWIVLFFIILIIIIFKIK